MSRTRVWATALALAFASAAARGEEAGGGGSWRPAPPPAATRELAAGDLTQAQRQAIATLQDLGFALEFADAARGVVRASRLDAYPLRLTVTLRAVSETTVRAEVVTEFAGAPIADRRAAEAFLAAFAEQLAPSEVRF